MLIFMLYNKHIVINSNNYSYSVGKFAMQISMQFVQVKKRLGPLKCDWLLTVTKAYLVTFKKNMWSTIFKERKYRNTAFSAKLATMNHFNFYVPAILKSSSGINDNFMT
jgi:hypothetical protein